MNALNQAELPLLHAIHDLFECGFSDVFFPLITTLGNTGIFWIILAAILLFFRKTRKAGIAMALSMIIGLLLCNLGLKPLTARIRPYDVDPAISLLIPAEHEFSFPSGHTTVSFDAAFALFLHHRKAGIAALILAAVISFSRLYLMVHYPTDVLFGAVLGIAIGFAGSFLAGKLVEKTKIPVL